MSDEIKVGHEVEWHEVGLHDCRPRHTGTVLALDNGTAWVRERTLHHSIRIGDLTRIAPEPVTLTPKYEVGERVHWLTTSRMKTIRAIVVGYRMEEDPNDAVWGEDELEPVPDVCPQCKGTGK